MQQRIIKELHIQSSVDPKNEIQKRIQFLKDYLLKTKSNGFVLGISGGQDSTLAGRLAQLAVEQLREGRPSGKIYRCSFAIWKPKR